jgi:hypothetical protein
MPGNHFWSDAKESEEGRAMDAVYEGIRRAVDRINSRR